MALIVEDGTGLDPTANSYGTVADLRTYATLRGVDLSSYSDSQCESFMVQAMDYIEAQRSRYKGRITSDTQPLQWPRSNVTDVSYIGDILDTDEIPRELIYAQYALAIEAKDSDLMASRIANDKGPIASEEVGEIKVSYHNPAEVKQISSFSKADALLAPLYKNNGMFLVRS